MAVGTPTPYNIDRLMSRILDMPGDTEWLQLGRRQAWLAKGGKVADRCIAGTMFQLVAKLPLRIDAVIR